MTVEELERALVVFTSDLRGGGGSWSFLGGGVSMACTVDAGFDRLRVVAPIVELAEIDGEQRDAMLEANFDRTLDARYATSEGVVYAAFMHRLSRLDRVGLESAIVQVASLVLTFDDGYSSGDLHFATGGGPSN